MEDLYITGMIKDFKSSLDVMIERIRHNNIRAMIKALVRIKKSGRLFIIGVGGGAAAASHAVQDFRKICGVKAYAPTDNVSELTARANDDGWSAVFKEYLEVHELDKSDGVLVLSCSGGKDSISQNIKEAVIYANRVGAEIMTITGDHDGYAATFSSFPIIVWYPSPVERTPFTEAMWSVLLHIIVNHPELKK